MAIAPASSQAFQAAVDMLNEREDRTVYRPDYGSQLRDTAAVLALAAEFTPSGVDIAALASRLSDLRDVARWTSTQEDGWTLIAAAALARETAEGSITVDGEELGGDCLSPLLPGGVRRWSRDHRQQRQQGHRSQDLGDRHSEGASGGEQ